MKKTLEYIKSDWKKTRGYFLYYIVFSGIMLSNVILNIAIGFIKENHVYYIVALWQVWGTSLILIHTESTRQSLLLCKELLDLSRDILGITEKEIEKKEGAIKSNYFQIKK